MYDELFTAFCPRRGRLPLPQPAQPCDYSEPSICTRSREANKLVVYNLGLQGVFERQRVHAAVWNDFRSTVESWAFRFEIRDFRSATFPSNLRLYT
jgi:hypothetical protein